MLLMLLLIKKYLLWKNIRFQTIKVDDCYANLLKKTELKPGVSFAKSHLRWLLPHWFEGGGVVNQNPLFLPATMYECVS